MKRLNWRSGVILLIMLLFGHIHNDYIYAEDNVITVSYKKETGRVNKKVFGNNFKGRDPAVARAVPNYAISDRGSGMWDPSANKPVAEVMDLAKQAGAYIVRYAIFKYKLENIIGKDREHPKYGLDEFLKTAEKIGAEPVIIIPVHPDIADTEQAADIVEYLNSFNDGSNPNGGIDWAGERAKNGRLLPYKVKYFEIGNETYSRHSGISSAEEYVDIYLRFYKAMKEVDPFINVGVVLPSNLGHSWIKYRKILPQIRDRVDFAIIHMYFNQQRFWDKSMSGIDTYKMVLSMPVLRADVKIQSLLKLLQKESGKNVPLAITEYNCWKTCSKRLVSALLNAELLKIFMKPENNILMANHWAFLDEPLYGMVKKYKYNETTEYMRRPNYYVYELYNKHFGEILINSDVKSNTYDVSGYISYIEHLKKQGFSVLNTRIPYLSVNASKNENGDKLYLMVINKNPEKAMQSLIELNDFVPSENADAWILNGPSMSSINKGKNRQNVMVKHREFEVENLPFKFTFEPHSLTAIEMRRKY